VDRDLTDDYRAPYDHANHRRSQYSVRSPWPKCS